jgi:hypothetical protein
VRVRFQTTEGPVYRPRVTMPVTIEADVLDETERLTLERLVEEARFFDLPSRVPATRDARDSTSHITIEAGGRRHSISVNDPVQGPALRRLIQYLRDIDTACQKAARAAGSVAASAIGQPAP